VGLRNLVLDRRPYPQWEEAVLIGWRRVLANNCNVPLNYRLYSFAAGTAHCSPVQRTQQT